ncbi:hypothetical protein C2E20_8901 [Micractinium conductrix]|uniref:Uncharacterized protein n=1 Tax=Micractinium conductrix TaxID=554055 RepID=A0A2P6V018_9CHLO|nr:hypothetical protein C2E20_8901 [Micractinium conductrix]|eukprot:PSC67438.1 hypothetical protein C2E20_8901 [Micractinium conductrix]
MAQRPGGACWRRRPTATAAARAALPHLLVAALALVLPLRAAAQQLGAPGDWQLITDLSQLIPGEVEVVGPAQATFGRPPPRTLDPHLLSDFEPALNLLQDLNPAGDTPFTDTSEQFVVTLHKAFVEGEAGLVYDAAGRVLHLPHFQFNRTSPLAPMPLRTPAQASTTCERHPALASVVQKYGGMYYHFVEEALPRVALLLQAGRLGPDVKLLTWGQPYEYEYLELLGVPRSQVVPYNASRVYCADRLLVPTPTPRITPPREALQLVRTGLGVRTLPEDERDLIIYVSRRGQPSRRVGNEEALLEAIRAAFPGQRLVVFNGDAPISQTIPLFQRARLVLGPHGAGLSHILFAAPGTTVVEFLFVADPPLMFWHTAAALGQQYWLLPVPQAYWMGEEMQVPADEVLDILSAALLPASGADGGAQAAPTCAPGSYATLYGEPRALRCTACSPGTYSYVAGAPACKPCAAGRYAAGIGASACRTCQPGTYSAPDGSACLDCPAGTWSVLPGAWTAQQCLTPEQRRAQQEDQALSVEMLSKLSPVFAETRRRMIEQTGGASSSQLSQAELCAAQRALAGGFADPYRGPYLMAAVGGPGATLAANCTDQPVFVAAPSPELPPVEVPNLPPLLLAPPPEQAEAEAPAPQAELLSPPSTPRATPVLNGSPVPQPPSPPPVADPPGVYPEKKKVVDDYVIILACVLGGLLVLPLLAWLVRRCYVARQHHKARTAEAASLMPAASAAGTARTAFNNPVYAEEDAASTASGRSSNAKLSRASPL